MTIQHVVAVCWLLFLLYWFISARSVKPTEETRGWLGGNSYPILLLISFLFIGDFKFFARFGIPINLLATLLVPRTMIVDILSIVFLVVGLVVAIVARRALAENWSAAVALQKDHQLITKGPYHYVRHPIYTGILLMVLGTILTLGTLGAWIGFLIIVFALVLKLRQEELLLTEHFSKEYSSYTKHTKILIPFIW